MDTFNFDTKQATPGWLTKILSKNGFLTQGKVSSIEQTVPQLANPVLASTFFSLNIDYSADSLAPKPSSILLKAINQEFLEFEGQRELTFYTSVSDSQDSLPLLTCYGTEVCPETKQYCLLLEDLALTHHQTPYPLPPLQEQCESAVRTLAEVHAFWWNHPLVGEESFERPTERRSLEDFELQANAYPRSADYLGARLPENRRRACWSRQKQFYVAEQQY